MLYTDTHAHLSGVRERHGESGLAALLDEYGRAAEAARLEGRLGPLILDPGVEAEDLGPRAEVHANRSFVRLAAGIWPGAEALSAPAERLARLERVIEGVRETSTARLSAIGEAGLDYYHMEGSEEAQRELFSGQASIAQRLGLPLLVHSRDAAAATARILAEARLSVPVVIHCFGYGRDEARTFLDLGCYLSFAGNLTYKKADALREACLLVPRDRLLLETDSPYMNPEPRRGKPTTPLDIERTYAFAAELRGERVEDLATAVTASAHLLFG